MKPVAFNYERPTTLADAAMLLGQANGFSKALAGGQSLGPMLNLRLAQPDLLVDITSIAELTEVSETQDRLEIGACITHANIEDGRIPDHFAGLMQRVAGRIAYRAVRNRGTIGGSIAHADPAAEMPGIAVTCDAEIAVTGSKGSRVIRADDFFVGALTTALEHDEIITEVRLPAWPSKRRWGFREFARRRGDFAMAAAALFYDQDASGKATNAHVGIIGLGDRPCRLPEVEAVLNGRAVDEATMERAAEVTSATVKAQEDIHASAAYRRSLAGTMVERALRSAAQ